MREITHSSEVDQNMTRVDGTNEEGSFDPQGYYRMMNGAIRWCSVGEFANKRQLKGFNQLLSFSRRKRDARDTIDYG